MRDEYLRYGFFQHRGLIAFAAGGAAAEAVLLTIAAPGSRPLAAQVTALAPIAAYHDVRWLFAGQQSAPLFALTAVGVLIARSAIDAVLLRLAWPVPVSGDEGHPPPGRPTMRVAFVSCAGLTVLAWLMQAPAVTLTFGVAVLPFSWPFLAAVPLVLSIATLLSHGGIAPRWWRRFPPAACVGWALTSFVMLSLFAAVTSHLAAVAAVALTAVAGVVNARAWYGIAGVAARLPQQVPEHASLWRSLGRVLWWIPVAPLAAVLVVAGAVGLVRLIFTGTIQIPQTGSVNVAAVANGISDGIAPPGPVSHAVGAVLVVAGFGSTCCGDTGNLRQVDPGLVVRQFSYAGMTAGGQPRPQGAQSDDVPLPLLGDRMAAQLLRLHDKTRRRVDIVAESEGTLGVYAMLARHPGLPIGSVVLLSPIIAPGQYSSRGSDAIPQDALDELNRLIGRMSPYGSSGAGQLIESVAAYGARYFDDVSRHHRMRYLVVVPLADATTMPDCTLPPSVMVVSDFHGGLLGDPQVQVTVGRFLAGLAVRNDNGRLREAAETITGAAAAWRMPVTHPLCMP